MTTYPLNTPAWLWEAYKATVPNSQTLDEPLHEHIAERVAADRRVDDEDRQRAAAFLDQEAADELGDSATARADGRGDRR